MVGLDDEFSLRVGLDALPLLVDRPEVVVGREFFERELALRRLGDSGTVVQEKAVAVGADRDGGVEHLRVIQRLLHAVAQIVDRAFGLDDGDGDASFGV